MAISKGDAAVILDQCKRFECRDHAFGDREVFFENDVGQTVAEGGSGGSYPASLCINDLASVDAEGFAQKTLGEFGGQDAMDLMKCGKAVEIGRNDETGPDEYAEGVTMPGLRVEDIRKEMALKPDDHVGKQLIEQVFGKFSR